MKVLQITHHTTPCIGGIEKFVFDLCLELKKRGIDSSILCLDKCPNSKKKLAEKEEINGVEIFRIPFFDLKYYKIAPKVLRFLKDFDVIHVHGIGFFSDFLALTKPFHKKKLVINTHGGFFHTKNLGLFKKIYFYTLNNLSLHLADKILADSKNDEQLFKKIINKKLELISLGVNLSEFLNLKTNPQNNRLLFVGRLSKNKGLEKLLETISLVVAEKPQTKLSVIGRDFDGIKSKLEKKVIKLGIEENVEFLGEVSRSRQLEETSKTRFCVSASEYEGFGIAVIEQMAAGNIPILNNIPNFNWFVTKNNSGFITDFSDPSLACRQIISAMSLFELKLQKMSDAAITEAKKFEWKNVIPKMIRVYKEN